MNVQSISFDRVLNDIQSYVDENLQLMSMGQRIPLTWIEPTIFEENPDYLQYWFKTDSIPADNKVDIRNTLFMTDDLKNFNSRHRSLVVIEYNRKTGKEFGLENSALVFNSVAGGTAYCLRVRPCTVYYRFVAHHSAQKCQWFLGSANTL